MKKKLSIITINYNNSKELNKTIESVVQQTYSDYELIVIDGGSIDESIEVIKNYEDKITFWSSEKDSGIYDAQNKGISKANGEYCLFLNSGDYLYTFDVLQKVFESNSVEDIIYGDIIYHENGSTDRRKIFPDKLTYYFLITDVIGHQVQFIKKSLFDKYGAYDKQYKIVADYEFFIRVIFRHKITTKHLPVFISVFDLSGLSSNTEQVKRINDERHKIHRIYFPKALVYIYHTYAALLQSYIYRLPIVSGTVKLARNIVFKFIKPIENK